LANLVAAAPSLRVLVTSRERLNLGIEWVLDVSGLPCVPLESDAAKLFLLSAQRAYPNLTLTDENRESVAQICSLVEGMPLAVELAASWVPVIPPEQIVCQIERNLDILAAQHSDFPDRHRSIRAAFNTSWERLTDQEQDVLKKLSVFRGV